ncbi:histidinol dehydrogenase [Humibacter ginsenosidimutans]|uniref:Histidinol dehydrogenase n=1 Tax=Humibacter ginsenosidimutans TaxID=2599293 RepID=A0A5B8M0B3_9MICO|nr:histidinol dehydrogenase [Humibacter ginsenosidimutans]QDZ13686.1 histidinol dehydrogenase [Humibacter ginsenosidimutans]
MRTIDLRGRSLDDRALRLAVPRPVIDISRASDSAASLIAEVRDRGLAALLEQAERFDGARPTQVRVAPEHIAAAVDSLSVEVRDALERSIQRVRAASSAQVPPPAITTLGDGAVVEQRWEPVNRAGLYVPGGKAPLASSVVMNAIPALVAGVPSVALASPAQREHEGGVHPTILGAAGLVGIDEVYAIGGAGAIAALAYGVPELGLEPVDVITGPGNIYVAAAKRLVRGIVGIDSEAGTTEILVIADESADPRLIAADLLSQAEHDEAAASLLVTDSEELIVAVQRELDVLVAATRNGGRAATALDGPQSAFILVDDEATAIRVSDAYAPEHLELQTADPERTLAGIHNAGAIFMGPSSPVSLGDYLAGSNHVLPTGGAARYSAGLGAATFLRSQQIIRYDERGLADVSTAVVALANAEQLPAHGEAVAARGAASLRPID